MMAITVNHIVTVCEKGSLNTPILTNTFFFFFLCCLITDMFNDNYQYCASLVKKSKKQPIPNNKTSLRSSGMRASLVLE